MSDLVRKLAVATAMSETIVQRVMASAPVRYKHYTIPKRGGGRRDISQPAREVKALQRALVDLLISNLPVHPAARAYRPGLSIRDNAVPHAGAGRAILKVDFRSFFPSITSRDWVAYCRETGCLTDASDIELTSSLLFMRVPGARFLRLAIGAPSSPSISNVLMNHFDTLIVERLAKDQVTYTRYADDLTFSAPRTGYLNAVLPALQYAMRAVRSPRLELNEKKTVYATSKFKRSVTGLVLANDGRVTIGKARKRRLHSAVCNAGKGIIEPAAIQVLAGHLAFVNAVEPEFLDVLRRRYGTDLIDRIQSFVLPSRLGRVEQE